MHIPNKEIYFPAVVLAIGEEGVSELEGNQGVGSIYL